MPLSIEEEAFLIEKCKNAINLSEMGLTAARIHFSDMMKRYSVKIKIKKITNHFVSVKDGRIMVRVYYPENFSNKTPVMMSCHGGGFVLGSLDSYDHDYRNYANALNCIVVAPEYRLAPEYRYPTAIEDCYATSIWIKNNIDLIGGDGNNFIIFGDSSGGNIAINVILKSIERNESIFNTQLLAYPLIGFSCETNSKKIFQDGYNVTSKTLSWCAEQYFPNGSGKDPVDILNMERTLLMKFPKTILITAEYDPLRDEGEIFCEKLKSVNVSVMHKRFLGTIHGFLSLCSIFPAAKDGLNFMADSVRRPIEYSHS